MFLSLRETLERVKSDPESAIRYHSRAPSPDVRNSDPEEDDGGPVPAGNTGDDLQYSPDPFDIIGTGSDDAHDPQHAHAANSAEV